MYEKPTQQGAAGYTLCSQFIPSLDVEPWKQIIFLCDFVCLWHNHITIRLSFSLWNLITAELKFPTLFYYIIYIYIYIYTYNLYPYI